MAKIEKNIDQNNNNLTQEELEEELEKLKKMGRNDLMG